MAECKLTKTVKVVLYLSEEETKFLMSTLQNSIPDLIELSSGGTCTPLEESAETKRLRENIFTALRNAMHF